MPRRPQTNILLCEYYDNIIPRVGVLVYTRLAKSYSRRTLQFSLMGDLTWPCGITLRPVSGYIPARVRSRQNVIARKPRRRRVVVPIFRISNQSFAPPRRRTFVVLLGRFCTRRWLRWLRWNGMCSSRYNIIQRFCVSPVTLKCFFFFSFCFSLRVHRKLNFRVRNGGKWYFTVRRTAKTFSPLSALPDYCIPTCPRSNRINNTRAYT